MCYWVVDFAWLHRSNLAAVKMKCKYIELRIVSYRIEKFAGSFRQS